MQSIKVLSLTLSVNDWLKSSRHPRILHVFDRACNLINENKEVLSIVTPEIGKGPFNLVMQSAVCISDYLSLESKVSIFPNQLDLGELSINATKVKLWNPQPDWERLHSERNNIINQLPITNYQPLLPNSLISNLSRSLSIADIPSALTQTSKLAGLGAGLTPAGDDFILGALYAVWIIHLPATARILAQAVAESAAGLTTSLSAAWLRSAGRGEAGILWHQLFHALISSDPVQVEKAMNTILAVGETSGADALAGFIGLFRGWSVGKS